LIVRAAISRSDRSFEEAALMQHPPRTVFWRVTLPMLKPSLFASALLVAVYVISDFGAVTMLRYSTFTQVIYFQMGGYDRASASVLSLVLIVLTALLLGLQWYYKRKQRYDSLASGERPPRRVALGRAKWFAYPFLSILVLFTAIIPILILLMLSYEAVQNGLLTSEWFGYVWNTVKLSAMTAIIVFFISLPLVYFKLRMRSRLSPWVDWLSYISYTLPGVIVALGVIFVFIRLFPPLYGTIGMLIVAYLLRYLPQSIESTETTMRYVSERLDEAAATLGRKPSDIVRSVLFPLTRTGLVAGVALVFVSVMKELPATLLLRPAGMDTLSVRVWIEASEGRYAHAGPSALLIVIISMLTLGVILKRK
ncbi:MAG: ABC transporter permease, partial [Bacilli bacterium]